jgi:hypothetical protein
MGFMEGSSVPVLYIGGTVPKVNNTIVKKRELKTIDDKLPLFKKYYIKIGV